MFCGFEKAPRIMRWFCKGRVVETDHPDFAMWLERMGKNEYASTRAIILLDVWKVQTSCGFAVPLLTYIHDPEKGTRGSVQERKTLENFAIKSIPYPIEMGQYRVKHNARSLDGLPGLRKAMKTKGENILVQQLFLKAKHTLRHWNSMLIGVLLALILAALLELLPTLRTRQMPWSTASLYASRRRE
ncbi:hypothetical protein AC579_5398 [Pseudocercospora musae]|uniref:Uncharacterized protein n=1 Tax=Pseudocercospora musae TaxID=113226 RepID=A0A139IDQ0_9PEZI|nr:hypothetical protein AC579_5398 [Pseudocercospora musae]